MTETKTEEGQAADINDEEIERIHWTLLIVSVASFIGAIVAFVEIIRLG